MAHRIYIISPIFYPESSVFDAVLFARRQKNVLNKEKTDELVKTNYSAMKEIRDLLYETVRVDDFALQFMRSDYFQRLRNIKQLTNVGFVWPFATGTRFAHSVGTYYVAHFWLEHLFQGMANPPSKRTLQLVCVGALLHDCGHVCFSHLSEKAIEGPLGLPDHEHRSQLLAREIARAEKIEISAEELDFVCAVIRGDVLPGYPPFLFEIVHNKETEFDADKLNYLAFDAHHLGFNSNLDLKRMLRFSKVKQGHVCFDLRAYWHLGDVFMKRYREHRDTLRHHAVISADRLVCRIVGLLGDVLDFRSMFEDFRWTQLNDYLLDQLPILLALPCWSAAQTEKLQEAEKLRAQLYRREWPKLRVVNNPSSVRPVNAPDTVRLGLCAADFHPLSKMRLFDSFDPNEENADFIFVAPENVSRFLPCAHAEVLEVQTVERKKEKNKS